METTIHAAEAELARLEAIALVLVLVLGSIHVMHRSLLVACYRLTHCSMNSYKGEARASTGGQWRFEALGSHNNRSLARR